MADKSSSSANSSSTLKVKELLQKLFSTVSNCQKTEIKNFLKDVLRTQPLKNLEIKDGQVEGELNLKSILNELKDGKGKTCMHFAAARGNMEIFSYLEGKGGNVDARDNQGNNCLFIAVQHGNLELLRYLVEEVKSDCTVLRDNKVGATHIAAGNGDIKMMEYLIKNRCKLGGKSDNGTELDWAVGSNKTEAVEWLLQQGINSRAKVGIAVMACGMGNLNMLKSIEKHNKDALNEKDHENWSLLQVAAEVGAKDIVQYLIDSGADVNYENQGKTAMELAWENDKYECIELLRPLSTKTLSGKKKKNEVEEGKTEPELSPEELAKRKEESLAIKTAGNELYAKNSYAPAIEKYTEAIKVFDKDPAYFTNRAACYIKLQKFAQAISDCQTAKKIDPKWIKSYFREGEAYFGLKEYGESAASYWEGLRLEPENKALKYGFENSVKVGKQFHNNQN